MKGGATEFRSQDSAEVPLADNAARQEAEHLLRLQRDLAVAVLSQPDSAGALQKLLEHVCRIPGVDSGGVYRVEGDAGQAHLLAHRGLGAAFVAAVSHVAPQDFRAKVLRAAMPFYLAAADLRATDPDGVLRQEGLRAVAVIPQRVEGRVVAALNLGSHTADDFSAGTRAAIESIAGLIGDVIVRLEAQEQMRRAQQDLARAVEERDRTFDAVPDLIQIMDADCRILRVNRAMAERVGSTPSELVGRRCYEVVHGLAAPPANCPHARLLASGRPETAEIVLEHLHGVFEVIVTPLCDNSGRLVGSVQVARDITARKRMESEVLRIGDWEKVRISQDLHDTLGQQFAGMAYLCQALAQTWKTQPAAETDKALAQIVAETQRAVELTRQVARGLAPVAPGPDGLVAALRLTAERAQQMHGVTCVLLADAGVAVPDRQIATHLYFIAQEAVTNAVRHGRAQHVGIRLQQDGDRGELVIEDDGAGLPAHPAGGSGIGLRIMQYRADLIGGKVTVEKGAQGGVRVRCVFDARGSTGSSERSGSP